MRRPEGGAAVGDRFVSTGLMIVLVLAATWAWWAWQQGAYFGTVLYPGIVVLCAVGALVVMLVPWPLRLRASPPAALALFALAGLGLWSIASALWSPSPETAVADGQRILTYAIAFGAGMWAAAMLGRHARLTMVPLAFAAAFAATAVIVGMLTTGTPKELLEVDGTLDYPLGYRNATAAFFLIAVWPALGVAADRDMDWRLRGPALAAASSCIGIALLSQSRGAIPAVALAVVVYALASKQRSRALLWLVLAALPALFVLPAATDLYRAVNDTRAAEALPELRAAGRALLGCAALAMLIGFAGAWIDSRRALPAPAMRRIDRGVGIGVVIAIAGGLAAFTVAVGDPVDWIGDRAEEFRSAGSPNLDRASGRFTLNAGSNRYDLWRVALDSVRDEPALGEGGGGFQYEYTRERESEGQDARDAHNVGLEVVSELGVPGLTMLLLALGGAALGAARSRGVGPSAAALTAVALAAGAYWLAHSSVDWFWTYPALTAPVFALLGAACAPAM